ncbi:MAG: hypothetical protein ACLRYE_03015 [Gemmiger formicilis]|uniref:hypothetical protein n=1 Tax=Gemmiger formicilis TaxID=745368 RepID=UPI0039A11502
MGRMDRTDAARIELQSTPVLPMKFLMAQSGSCTSSGQTKPAAAGCSRSSARMKLKIVSVMVTLEPRGSMMLEKNLPLAGTVDTRGLDQRQRQRHIVLAVHEDTGRSGDNEAG